MIRLPRPAWCLYWQVDAASEPSGYIPLHLACITGHVGVVGLLLSRSTELLKVTDNAGRTCLHVAAASGHYDMVQVLIGQGADLTTPDKEGWTALHCAASAGFLDVVKLLVESGATSEVRWRCVTGSDIYTSEDNQEWSDISVVRGQRGPQQRPLLPPQGETRQLRAPRGQAGQWRVEREYPHHHYVYPACC